MEEKKIIQEVPASEIQDPLPVPRKNKPFWMVGIAVVLLVILAAAGYFLFSPQNKKVYRVGILSGLNSLADIADSFRTGMAEMGYTEGKNIVYDFQKTNFEHDKEKKILQKFVDDKVDLIFTFPTEVALAAKTVTRGTNIPVVFAFSTIEGNNLVGSVRQPGDNITGVRETGPDIAVKRLEILHELAPQAKRVYITYNPSAPPVPPALNVLRKASSQMNITLVENPIATVEDIGADLQKRSKLKDIGIDAILLMGEPISASLPALKVITEFASEHKVPVGGIKGQYSIEKENLPIIFTYEINTRNVGNLAVVLVDKILKGTKAGTIPVITPEAELLINYKAIQALGLTVPESLLSRAAEIIR
jgi:putative tryptophan/tyrosine transport system substrate-binding protein